MHMRDKSIPPILIHYNSNTTIGQVHNKYYDEKSRSIRRKHSIMRSLPNKWYVNIDHLTKAPVTEKVYTLRG